MPAPLAILGAWASTSAGADSEKFLHTVSSRKLRPTPDNLLCDDDGFPLLSSRARFLDTAEVARELESAITSSTITDASTPHEERDLFLRTLALLHSVLDQVIQDFSLLSEFEISPAGETPVPLLRGGRQSDNATAPVHLQVKLIVSANLTAHEKQTLQKLIIRRLQLLHDSHTDLTLDLISGYADTTAFSLAHEFMQSTEYHARPHALLLLSGDSSLCPTVVQEWAHHGLLFDSRRPNGLMMGEGAFAILFADKESQSHLNKEPLGYLASIANAQRDLSADISGRTSHACLASTIASAIKTAGLSADAIGTVVCDTDHRASRVLESVAAMTSETPQLDTILNRFAINEVCGHLGATSAPALLVAGARQVHETQCPVLLFSVSHSRDRAAAIILPAIAAETAALPSRSQVA